MGKYGKWVMKQKINKLRFGRIILPGFAVAVAVLIGISILLVTHSAHSSTATGSIKGVGGLCLDVQNSTADDDGDVDINPCTSAVTQQWKFASDGTIRTGDYCLIDKGGSSGTETHARVATCGSVKDASWQDWRMSTTGEIISASSQLCLEVRQSLAKTGNSVWLDNCTSSSAGETWTTDASVKSIMTSSPASSPSPSISPEVSSSSAPAALLPVDRSTISVSTAAQLTGALANAKPGETIKLADGTYSGNFNSTVSGRSGAPITIEGGRGAILNGGTLASGYTFSLGTKDWAQAISDWRVQGFTITGGKKGVIFDNVSDSTISGLYVHEIGEEGIHLRDNSRDDIIEDNTISHTGQYTQAYGEGIYIGSAFGNWGAYSQGKPDLSNNDQIIGNTISYTGAENIDIKEGTHDGLIKDNIFNGHGMCYNASRGCNYADSWVDMKGTGWTIIGNTGSYEHAVWESGSQSDDGFQDHVISTSGYVENSGLNNIFVDNTVSDVAGYGFYVVKSATGVVVGCSNKVIKAARGFSDLACNP